VHEHGRAIALMLFSTLCFAVMGAFVKLAADVPVVEKVMFRNLVTLVVAGGVVLKNRRAPFGRRGNRRWLVLRSVLGVGGVGCYFWAIDHLLLADAAMLNKLSPFFVFLLAGAALKERQRRSTFVALLLAFAGALCVIKPRFDLEMVPALVGLASAFFAGAAYTVLRFLRDREPPETIVFVFSAVTVLMTAPVVAVGFSSPSGPDVWWLLGIGVAAAGGQFALTSAYHHAPATEVSLYSYAVIVFSAVLGFVLFDEIPDALSVVGGLLILAGGAMVWVLRPRPYSTNTSDSHGQ